MTNFTLGMLDRNRSKDGVWAEAALREGFGARPLNSVVTWRVIMLGLFGLIVAIFSPLFFK